MFEQVDATVSSVIDFPRFDLQYFGTEYHSALALRLAIVAKPQIIVLDSDAPFISVSKFVSILRENDVNCVLILLEGSGARHEPCPGIAAIRLGRNDLSPQRVQDAFRLTNVRIYHAKRLLAEDPTQRIHQVAAMAGFDDQRYFSKVFRRAAGCTPQQYAASIPRKEVPSP